jgi:hypothetical protein
VWLDGAFIECSIDTEAHTNNCTVRDSKGILLQSGPFLLNDEGREAIETELKYSGYRGRKIYLEDARFLYPVLGGEEPRPPIDSNLALLAGHGMMGVRNCGRIAIGQEATPASQCAMRAFMEKLPFVVRYDLQGYEGIYFFGLAGDESGRLYALDDYTFLADMPPLATEGSKPVYQVRVKTTPCPSPVHLRMTNGGRLTCLSTNP